MLRKGEKENDGRLLPVVARLVLGEGSLDDTNEVQRDLFTFFSLLFFSESFVKSFKTIQNATSSQKH